MREPSSSGFGSSRTLKVTPVYAPPLIITISPRLSPTNFVAG
jgi:hypothetical protein